MATADQKIHDKIVLNQDLHKEHALIDSVRPVALFFHQAGAGGCIDLSLQCSPLIVAAVDRASQVDEAIAEIACSLSLTNRIFDRPKLVVDRR